MWGRAVSEGGAPNGGARELSDPIQTKADGGPPAKIFPITLEAVQLCVENADRLLDDSKKVSGPTALALAEVALEEVLKGLVLFFHRTDTAHDIHAPRREQSVGAPSGAVVSFLSAIRGINPEELFRSHQAKLSALSPALNFVSEVLSTFPRESILRHMKTSIPGGALIEAPTSEEMNAVTREAKSQDDGMRALGTKDLRRLAMGGLYVDRTEGGRIVSPSSISVLPAEKIQIAAVILLLVLRGHILGATGISSDSGEALAPR